MENPVWVKYGVFNICNLCLLLKGQFIANKVNLLLKRCPERDLNPQVLYGHKNLNLACLPISPSGQTTFQVQSIIRGHILKVKKYFQKPTFNSHFTFLIHKLTTYHLPPITNSSILYSILSISTFSTVLPLNKISGLCGTGNIYSCFILTSES